MYKRNAFEKVHKTINNEIFRESQYCQNRELKK